MARNLKLEPTQHKQQQQQQQVQNKQAKNNLPRTVLVLFRHVAAFRGMRENFAFHARLAEPLSQTGCRNKSTSADFTSSSPLKGGMRAKDVMHVLDLGVPEFSFCDPPLEMKRVLKESLGEELVKSTKSANVSLSQPPSDMLSIIESVSWKKLDRAFLFHGAKTTTRPVDHMNVQPNSAPDTLPSRGPGRPLSLKGPVGLGEFQPRREGFDANF